MAQKIYTKTGDNGNTALIGGTKVPKNDLRIETYGTVDELNSWMGLVADQLNDADVKGFLKEIQDRLFTIGSLLATDAERAPKMHLPDLYAPDVEALEKKIDVMTDQLPSMKHFILPGGHVAVSSIHVTRCVCRRAERLAVGLKEQGVFVDDLVLRYLNRLSDYLFTLARYTAQHLQVPEVVWKPRI